MRNAAAIALACSLLFGAADEPRPVFQTNVDLVVLTFSVTDSKGNPVTGLKPTDVRILEDGVPQKIASFAEGSKRLLRIRDDEAAGAGANVFILFDTSNRMYSMFPYVCDAIADFVRRLDPADSVAIYTFSRNLSRAAPLTKNHLLARAGLTNVVAGDDTALLNALLLTLRDAAKTSGRKAVVVFSSGPDNASMVSPDDVSRVAENEGIPVYIVSTLDASADQPLTAALQLLVARTGGKLYWARRWQDQTAAFASVREDIGSSYTACYYPAPNPNTDFRRIQVDIVDPRGKNWRVRARAGYQARPNRVERGGNHKN